MDNLGKAIYMACSVFLFIIAATASIYLYGTLNSYLGISTQGIGIDKRAEVTNIDGVKKQRDITRSEIYITLFNMEQMHIDNLTVNNFTVSKDDVINKTGDYSNILRWLRYNPTQKYVYSSSGSSVTYKNK